VASSLDPPPASRSPYEVLAAAINAQVSLRYHTTITLLQYPSQGDFPWYYENANQIFNNDTFGYISARVSPGDAPGLARLSEPGGFPNAYAQLLSQIGYSVSSADRAARAAAAADEVSRSNQLLSQLAEATERPSAASGGMLTVDPRTGAVSAGWQVGYAIKSSLAAIQNGLTSQEPAISVSVPAPGPDAAAVTLRFTGCQMVAIQPAAWQQATRTGWFYPELIAEAFRNGQQDVTGYRFITAPACTPGPLQAGGDLGLLVGLLISNPPTVTVAQPSVRRLRAAPPERVLESFFDSLRLLDLGRTAIVSVPGVAPAAPVTRGRAKVGAVAGPSVPLLQQTAYVVGASLRFPAGG
jgi:hypothetical protein